MKSSKEIAQLFFETRQLIRSKLPHGAGDPNEWMRCEMMRFVGTSQPPPTMRDIAEYLRIKAPSVTSLIIRMEREGMVTRVKEKEDRRIVRIGLTEKGNNRVRKYLNDASSTMEKVFSKISRQDIAVLTRILRSLQEAHRA